MEGRGGLRTWTVLMYLDVTEFIFKVDLRVLLTELSQLSVGTFWSHAMTLLASSVCFSPSRLHCSPLTL